MKTGFRDILVHVRDFQERTSAARFGAALAKAYGASLMGVCVCPARRYTGGIGASSMTAVLRDEERRHVEEAIKAGPIFQRWAEGEGIDSVGWVVVEAELVDALMQAAMRHDLLVLDHPGAGHAGEADEIASVVLGTRAACMVVPRRWERYDGFKRIAIGWNGSPEAMRAIYATLPLLRSRRVLLMMSRERQAANLRVEWQPPLDILKYLERHDVHVDETFIDVDRKDVGGALLDAAAEYGAGLLVMGAYGRSRLSEWVLGGATRDVLTNAAIPVLMRH